MMRLSVKGLGLALGVTWGAGVFVLGLIGAIGWGRAVVTRPKPARLAAITEPCLSLK